MPRKGGSFQGRTDYPPDEGCDLSPRCTTCNLPKCRHDMTMSEVRMLFLSETRREALALLRKGEKVSTVAKRFHISDSSVRKWRDLTPAA